MGACRFELSRHPVEPLPLPYTIEGAMDIEIEVSGKLLATTGSVFGILIGR
jgi:hypothetical protein